MYVDVCKKIFMYKSIDKMNIKTQLTFFFKKKVLK